MTSRESCLCQSVDRRCTLMRRGQGKEETELPFHVNNSQVFILNNHTLMIFIIR